MATTFDLSASAARIARDYAGKLAGKANASYCVPMVLGPTGLTASVTLTLWTTGEGVRTQIDNTELGDNLYVQRRPREQNQRDAAALGPVARAWAGADGRHRRRHGFAGGHPCRAHSRGRGAAMTGDDRRSAADQPMPAPV